MTSCFRRIICCSGGASSGKVAPTPPPPVLVLDNFNGVTPQEGNNQDPSQSAGLTQLPPPISTIRKSFIHAPTHVSPFFQTPIDRVKTEVATGTEDLNLVKKSEVKKLHGYAQSSRADSKSKTNGSILVQVKRQQLNLNTTNIVNLNHKVDN